MVVNMLEIIIELQIHLVKREREREKMIYFEYIIYVLYIIIKKRQNQHH